MCSAIIPFLSGSVILPK